MGAQAPAAPSVVVRRLQLEEASALRDVRLRALRTDPSAFGSTWERENTLLEATWQERAQRGAGSADNPTWVAVAAEGSFGGLISALRADTGAVQLFSMWVDPALRGQGVGGRLLDTALRWTDAVAPAREVKLEVNPRQRAAVRLYLSRGFRFTAEERPVEHTPGEVVRAMVRPPSGDRADRHRGASPPDGSIRGRTDGRPPQGE